MKKRTMALLAAMLLIVGVVIGSTLAWLTAKTETVTNTFTTSDINIELKETKGTKTDNTHYSFKMIPGYTIEKDPVVTVKAGSEACFLFVKLEEVNGFGNYMTYAVDTSKWTPLENGSNIYYQKVDATNVDKPFEILEGNVVTVRDTVTKEMMNSLNASNYPELKITAYASQRYKNSNNVEFDVKTAWNNANSISSN